MRNVKLYYCLSFNNDNILAFNITLKITILCTINSNCGRSQYIWCILLNSATRVNLTCYFSITSYKIAICAEPVLFPWLVVSLFPAEERYSWRRNSMEYEACTCEWGWIFFFAHLHEMSVNTRFPLQEPIFSHLPDIYFIIFRQALAALCTHLLEVKFFNKMSEANRSYVLLSLVRC